jgi:hypothetical protein
MGVALDKDKDNARLIVRLYLKATVTAEAAEEGGEDQPEDGNQKTARRPSGRSSSGSGWGGRVLCTPPLVPKSRRLCGAAGAGPPTPRGASHKATLPPGHPPTPHPILALPPP